MGLLWRLDHSHRGRVFALVLLIVLLLMRVPYAAAHEDLGRDMFVAWRLLRGDAFPLEGPQLAATTHLGPIWYYVLAALQFAGRTWYGTIALLGLLASLQIPLAYLLGKELHSRRAGLLWAVGLLVPSWTTYEWMLPLHPTLSAPLVLAFLLCSLRYWRGGERRYFFGMALSFVLALHAHPSNVGLAWIGLFVVLRSSQQRPRWRDWVLAAALVLLPLLPFLYADAMRGFADLHSSGAYLSNRNSVGSPLDAGVVFLAIVDGGTRFLFESLMGWDAWIGSTAASLIALGGVAGCVGLVRALRDAQTRRLVLFGIAATVLILTTATIMRKMTPYYMTTASRVMLAGLVAIGLATLGESVAARGVRIYAAAVALLACMTITYGGVRVQIRGAWPFSWLPAFDVKQPPSEIVPLLLTPAYAMGNSGRFLCAQAAPSIHGTYASQLLHNYAMDMRMACGRADVHLGGNEAGRQHWLGMSRAMFARSGVLPVQKIGPIGIVPALPVSESRPLMLPAEPRYPVYLPDTQAPTLHHVSVAMAAAQHLAISNLAFALSGDPEIAVKIDGAMMTPVAKDRVTAVYACAHCQSGTSIVAEVDIKSGDFVDIDIVLF